MYYLKLVTLKFDFKMDVPNQPKNVQRVILALTN